MCSPGSLLHYELICWSIIFSKPSNKNAVERYYVKYHSIISFYFLGLIEQVNWIHNYSSKVDNGKGSTFKNKIKI